MFRKNEKEKTAFREFLSYVFIIVIVVLIRTYIVTPVMVSGSSMNTTLQDKEIMILNKITYRFNDIKRFDIVVIKQGKEHIIKRVIALPGETIEVKDDKLLINGEVVSEYYKNQSTEDFSEVLVDDNCYFVMGDNRSASLDSRYIGCINRKDILGKANLVLFPFDKIGYKK